MISSHGLFEDFNTTQYKSKKRRDVEETSVSPNEVEVFKSFETNIPSSRSTLKRVSSDKISDEFPSPTKRQSVAIEEDKKPKQQTNQKQAAQRYRQNLKQKSQKVDEELKEEVAKNGSLKTILGNLETAVNMITSSLIKHTKVDNVASLYKALKDNGLTFAANNFAEMTEGHLPLPTVLQNQKEQIVVSNVVTYSEAAAFTYDDRTQVPVPAPSPAPTPTPTPTPMPVLKLATMPFTSSGNTRFSDYEDDDCTVNRFQELFQHIDDNFEILDVLQDLNENNLMGEVNLDMLENLEFWDLK